ncbi:cation-translocating P-type ATPase [Candidatus Binatia bacterium]|nr:cation-translocating P-type ATPase [Candidatus Binatia bacterium]
MVPTAWHATPADEVARQLGTSLTDGLSGDTARSRLVTDGANELRQAEGASRLAILAGQFQSLVVWILIGAAGISIALGEVIDGGAIVAIVILNAVIGFFQEYRAEQAVAALARMAAPRARVVRDARAEVVASRDIVRGDLLLIDAGDLVAADARLVDASVLRTNEAPLTGESEPVEKNAAVSGVETPLADRRSMVFLGTSVTSGTGRAVVVATGMETEVGRIAGLLETASGGDTPLKRRLDQVARRLLWACAAIVVLVFILGVARGLPTFELFLSAVSLAVAAIPEGLPAIVTVALALGVSRMVRRNALIRRLPAVETLGCAQVICTDKTGTLTVGQMTARKVVTAERVFGVTGEGYTTDGVLFGHDAEVAPLADEPLLRLLRAAAACNDAILEARESGTRVVGDPTEGALLVVAAKGGVTAKQLDVDMPRLRSIPFDSDRKRMTVVRTFEGQSWAFVKGAPEVVLTRCSHVRTAAGIVPMTDAERARVDVTCALLANDALRVLALAERQLQEASADPTAADDDVEQGLTFLGLVGLQDPPRAEARDAIARCRRAGIRVVMITGDHPDTARSIARELGILETGEEVIVGAELARMDDAQLAGRVRTTAAYARVTAEDKLRIVRAWKAQGAVVAMTGDGVNDAPALKEASIGIAMGVSGTEVTKQAADMVVTDDNFASIVAAIEEGRGIYDNIAKTLGYLLAGNAGELAVMLVAVLVGWPLPLLPIQLLWINLVTDGLPALALATDPIDPDVLSRPPRKPSAELIDRPFLVRLAITGLLTAACTLAVCAYELRVDGDLPDARNAAFSVLVIAELLRSFGARSETRTILEVGLLSNLRLFLVVAVSFALQLAIHHTPVLEHLFGAEPITLAQCLVWVVVGAMPLVVLELRKIVTRPR